MAAHASSNPFEQSIWRSATYCAPRCADAETCSEGVAVPSQFRDRNGVLGWESSPTHGSTATAPHTRDPPDGNGPALLPQSTCAASTAQAPSPLHARMPYDTARSDHRTETDASPVTEIASVAFAMSVPSSRVTPPDTAIAVSA